MTRTVRPWAADRPTPLVSNNGVDATLWIYDAIDSYGGDWGVSAKDVRNALEGLAGVPLALRVNSPGGDYFEAVAIRSLLAEYPGAITVHIDGLAASAATVIATAGERVVMAPGAQYMIHDALTMAIGNAADLLKTAELLDQCSEDIAGFYAARAGGTAAEFRAAMKAETWYTADQAVAAGLADEVTGAAPERAVAATADRWIAALRQSPTPALAPVTDPEPEEDSEPPAAAKLSGRSPLSELVCSALTGKGHVA